MQSSMFRFLAKDDENTTKRQKTSHSALTYEWTEFDTLLILKAFRIEDQEITHHTCITAFDLDGTLIKTKSGKAHAKDIDDWTLFSPTVPDTLAAQVAKGSKIVIISNQKGISLGKSSISELKHKVEKIVRQLNVPLIALFATGEDEFRKPRTGSWSKLIRDFNGEQEPESATYIGDAAGRVKSGTRKKDFSASDYKFSLNLGIAFHTPEHFFLLSRSSLHTDFSRVIEFDPRCMLSAGTPMDPADALELSKQPQEMIVLVGSPACGKSTFCKDNLASYARINQDTLGTVVACKKACGLALANGQSVVIDNTNRSVKTRDVWIQVAKAYGNIPVRCFQFNVSKELVFHLNTFRHLTDPSRPKLSTMVIHSYFKQFEAVDLKEGFSQLVTLHFNARCGASKLLTSFLL